MIGRVLLTLGPRWRWPGRPLNVGAVAAATIRETSRVEYEYLVGVLRQALVQVRDWQQPAHETREQGR